MRPNKKEIQPFINKSIEWAKRMNFQPEQMQSFKTYIYSDVFFDEVAKCKRNSKNQIDFNQNVTELVSNKLKELLQFQEFCEELENILEKL